MRRVRCSRVPVRGADRGVDVNDARIAALVDDDQVHRDVYLDPQLFALERERLWSRSWLHVAHDSQLPRPGDRLRVTLLGAALELMREPDGRIAVCRLDGSAAPVSHVHRGFVFVRLRGGVTDPPDSIARQFADACGAMLTALDLIAQRSPLGRLVLGGGCLRTLVRANWKIYLENIVDAVHAPITHRSATDAALHAAASLAPGAPQPPALRQLLPFGSGWDAFEAMGERALPAGHGILGTHASLHSAAARESAHARALAGAWGEARAAEVLAFAPQNAVLYPGFAIKASPCCLRVIRPLAVDRTIVEAWALQPAGLPATLLQDALRYNRLVFSPMSVLAHDDLHVFETIQRSLRARGNPWISLHRGSTVAEREGAPRDAGGTSELLMRNQYRAWLARMTEPD